MNVLKDILLQLFFFIVPSILYYIIVHKHHSTHSLFKRQILAFLFCTTSAIFSIHFPIVTPDGYSIHFAFIPLIIAFIYSGYLAGLLTIGAFFMYPFFLSEPVNILHTYVLTPLMIVVPLYIHSTWKYLSSRQKYTVAFVISCIIYSLHTIEYLIFNVNRSNTIGDTLFQILWTCTIIVCFTMLIIYLVEFLCGFEEMQIQLKKLRKLSHLNELANEVTLEVNKPLTIVKGFAQLLGIQPNQVNKEYVPIILTELSRAERIFNSYLKLAQVEAPPSGYISSSKLLENVIDELYIYAKNNNVTIHVNSKRSWGVKGNMQILSESIITILKYCIDFHSGEMRNLSINHYLYHNEVTYEVNFPKGVKMKENFLTLRHLSTLIGSKTDQSLYSAYTLVLAHGGDVTLKRKIWRKSMIISLPAHSLKS
ncbi:histidine kinase dimerization/phospho-acceptor domain-containing protein [Sutcliffiella rhizosphaerae]|uniref:histidine kinase n=1 Tax=Sutcliffiella rhizosphaerae TaxID=2880967 RepID=A0ABM8YPF1_9BACI|nr:histidine kinase dimerization/phospho-acceptor domain-containing protein [Sutcliffiella rhizosphaerae]CAG9621792.1 hypothetical protein BACCIP111883_02565 [Sutcliffiella rhizosphaerae]